MCNDWANLWCFSSCERPDLHDPEGFSKRERPDLRLRERSRTVRISKVLMSGGPELRIRHIRRPRRLWVTFSGGSEVRRLDGPKVRRCPIYDDSRTNHGLEGGRSVAACICASLSCSIVAFAPALPHVVLHGAYFRLCSIGYFTLSVAYSMSTTTSS